MHLPDMLTAACALTRSESSDTAHTLSCHLMPRNAKKCRAARDAARFKLIGTREAALKSRPSRSLVVWFTIFFRNKFLRLTCFCGDR